MSWSSLRRAAGAWVSGFLRVERPVDTKTTMHTTTNYDSFHAYPVDTLH